MHTENRKRRYAAIRSVLKRRRERKYTNSAGAVYVTTAGKRTSAGLGKTPLREQHKTQRLARRLARRRNRP